MRSLARALVVVVLALTAVYGCAARRLEVGAVRRDVVAGELDSQWFERSVYSKAGALEAIELVWCPDVPNQQVVCRTAIIWKAGESLLVDELGADPVPTPAK